MIFHAFASCNLGQDEKENHPSLRINDKLASLKWEDGLNVSFILSKIVVSARFLVVFVKNFQ